MAAEENLQCLLLKFFPCLILHRVLLVYNRGDKPNWALSSNLLGPHDCFSTIGRNESCEPSLLVYAQVRRWWRFRVLTGVVVADVGMEEGFSGNGLGAWSTRGLNRKRSESRWLNLWRMVLRRRRWLWVDVFEVVLIQICTLSKIIWLVLGWLLKSERLFWHETDIIWLVLGWLERRMIQTWIAFRMLMKTMKLSRKN